MGRESPSQARFRKMVRQAREDRRLSQADVAEALKTRGIDNMYPTTVAKIEAGGREVKLDEAAALADLFGMALDAMLGKNLPDESSLTFALLNVSSYTSMALRYTVEAEQTAADLGEILEDIEARFERSGVPDLMGLAEEAARHLKSARGIYERLSSASFDIIPMEDRGDVR